MLFPRSANVPALILSANPTKQTAYSLSLTNSNNVLYYACFLGRGPRLRPTSHGPPPRGPSNFPYTFRPTPVTTLQKPSSPNPSKINTSTTVDSTPLHLPQNQHLQKTGRGVPLSLLQSFATRQQPLAAAVRAQQRPQPHSFHTFTSRFSGYPGVGARSPVAISPRASKNSASEFTPRGSRRYPIPPVVIRLSTLSQPPVTSLESPVTRFSPAETNSAPLAARPQSTPTQGTSPAAAQALSLSSLSKY